jgi:WD40 repeat protein
MASGDRAGSIILWDLQNLQQISKNIYFGDWVRDIRVSREETTLYACSSDETIKIINLKDGSVILTI